MKTPIFDNRMVPVLWIGFPATQFRSAIESAFDGNLRFVSICDVQPLDFQGQPLVFVEACGRVEEVELDLEAIVYSSDESDRVLIVEDWEEAEGQGWRSRGYCEVLVGGDITERSLRQLHRSFHQVALWRLRAQEMELRYRLTLESAVHTLWLWDTDRDEIEYSRNWQLATREREKPHRGAPGEWLGRIHPNDATRLQYGLEELKGGLIKDYEQECLIRGDDGTYRWSMVRAVGAPGAKGSRVRYLAGSITDISDRKFADQRLKYAQLHDMLTGLPNQTFLLETMEGILDGQKAGAGGGRFALLVVDIDEFSRINDSLGHARADRVLIEVARRLTQFASENVMVARLGGDEFAFLMKRVEDTDALADFAIAVQRIVEEPCESEDGEIHLTAAVGIALGPGDYTAADQVLRDADNAANRAKASGRGGRETFSAEMHDRVTYQLRLEGDMRRAIEREEFHVHFQPVIEVSSEEVVGAEALVRWVHPLRGMIMPDDFIPLAEETGLIGPIGLRVLREACRRMAHWRRRRGDLLLSVNLSRWQLMQPGLAGQVREELDRTAMPASALYLEITETLLGQPTPVMEENFRGLRALGIRMALDDFGKGYSSLGYLKRFQFDYLKIDRQFVSGIEEGGRNLEIVRTIASLGHSLGLKLIAEGVETVEQRELLRELGVHYFQGFLYSKPLKALQLEELLEREGLGAPVAE